MECQCPSAAHSDSNPDTGLFAQGDPLKICLTLLRFLQDLFGFPVQCLPGGIQSFNCRRDEEKGAAPSRCVSERSEPTGGNPGSVFKWEQRHFKNALNYGKWPNIQWLNV